MSKLKDLCEIRGRVGWKGYTVEDLSEKGPLVLGANDITNDNQLDLSDVKHLTREKYEESPEIYLKKDDILVVKVGSTIGKVCIINKDLGEATINPNCVIVRAIRVNPYYLYYYLCSPAGKAYLLNNSSASGQPALNQKDLGEMDIPIISEDKQFEISEFLNTLNTKIEINNQIGSEIERLSMCIYKYWFLQYEFPDDNGKPYKSSGGKMKWCEELNREIPYSWNLGKTTDLGEIVAGGTPSTSNTEYYTDKGIGWITPKDLSISSDKYIAHGERDITELGLKNSSARLMPKGTVLLSSRAPIGYVAIASESVSTNQGFKSIVPKKEYGSEFVYYTIKNLVPYLKSLGSGSTFTEISKKDVSEMTIVLPPKHIVNLFNLNINDLGGKRFNVEEENKDLCSIRDFLLPMLINGQISVEGV